MANKKGFNTFLEGLFKSTPSESKDKTSSKKTEEIQEEAAPE